MEPYFGTEYFSLCIIISIFIIPITIWNPREIMRNLKHSIIISPIGSIFQYFYYLDDYWNPGTITSSIIGIEDFIFTFLLSIFTFSIYPFLLKGKYIKVANISSKKRRIIAFFAGIYLVLLHVFLINFYFLNSVVASSIFFSSFALLIFAMRRDLIFQGVLSGLLVLLMLFMSYQLLDLLYPQILFIWCTGCNPTGLRVLGINIEEIIWDFTWGVFGSVILPFLYGNKIYTLRK